MRPCCKCLLRLRRTLAIVAHMNKITLKAVEAAGGTIALGKALGITRQAVEQWHTVPPERVLDVERLSGISRYDLRPDIYGAAPDYGTAKKKARHELRAQRSAA